MTMSDGIIGVLLFCCLTALIILCLAAIAMMCHQQTSVQESSTEIYMTGHEDDSVSSGPVWPTTSDSKERLGLPEGAVMELHEDKVGCLFGDDHSPMFFRFADRRCAICLYNFKLLEGVMKSSPACKHIFHEVCMRQWLSYQRPECPCCREPLPDNVLVVAPHTTTDDNAIDYSSSDENFEIEA